jgi:hypothetical protein
MTSSEVRQLARLITNGARVFGENWMVGSPSYGALKFHVPDWGIVLIQKYVKVELSESTQREVYAFGRKMGQKYNYQLFYIIHEQCEVELKILDSYSSFKDNQLYYTHRFPRDMEFTVVGDTYPLQEVLTYMNLISNIDNQSNSKLF